MARKKMDSPIIRAAVARSKKIKTIDETLDFGEGLTVPNYDAKITAAAQKQDNYNTLLSAVDTAQNEIKDMLKELADWNERMLAGVASRFGKNSSEYEQAGGTRKSEIKRPRRATKKKEEKVG